MRTDPALPTPATTRALLVSDLDGTLIPPIWNDAARRGLDEFRTLVRSNPDLVLAYATGRHLELALAGIRADGLPVPALLVSDVGTRVFIRRTAVDGWTEDPEYARRIAPGDTRIEDVRRIIGTVGGVELQEPEKQGRFKASFYTDPALDSRTVRERVRNRLGDQAPEFQVVFSVDRVDGRGLLDLLPRAASKASATAYLQELAGLDRGAVLYAGDSGNDVEVMVSGFNAVLVGNAPDDLREEIREAAERNGVGDHVYFAKAPFAAGVVEGCRHFRFPAPG